MSIRRSLFWTFGLVALSAGIACSTPERDSANAGNTGEGGDGGSSAGTSSGVGTLGEPCAAEGALACEGHAQRVQLRCTNGTWAGGRVRCWGSGANGKLGYGSTSNVGATNTRSGEP